MLLVAAKLFFQVLMPFITIGYRYSTRTTLTLHCNKKPFGNVIQHLVERPEVLSDFLQKSNSIDKHNQL
jgi:hypothetical protein